MSRSVSESLQIHNISDESQRTEGYLLHKIFTRHQRGHGLRPQELRKLRGAVVQVSHQAELAVIVHILHFDQPPFHLPGLGDQYTGFVTDESH